MKRDCLRIFEKRGGLGGCPILEVFLKFGWREDWRLHKVWEVIILRFLSLLFFGSSNFDDPHRVRFTSGYHLHFKFQAILQFKDLLYPLYYLLLNHFIVIIAEWATSSHGFLAYQLCLLSPHIRWVSLLCEVIDLRLGHCTVVLGEVRQHFYLCTRALIFASKRIVCIIIIIGRLSVVHTANFGDNINQRLFFFVWAI